MRVTTLSLVLSALAVGCAPEPTDEAFFDDSLGMEAEPVAPGALEGTFALKTINATLVIIPILDDQLGGGVNYRLVTRTYDDASDTYRQRSELCGGYNIEVAGVTTDTPQSTYRRVPPSTEEVITVGADGQYTADGHLQLWAIDFEEGVDAFTEPLPASADEADEAPHKDRIVDMEDDGKPGLTMFVNGAVTGEVYAIQRKFVDLAGITLGPDRILGLADNRWENLMLSNNNPLLDRQDEGAVEPYPDPKESWFEEVRIAEGSDCDDVIAAAEQGDLSRTRPF